MQTTCSGFVLVGLLMQGGGSPIPPYPFWSVWPSFLTWERLFLVALGALTVYALFSDAMTLLLVRRTKALIHDDITSDAGTTSLSLRKQCARLDKLIGTAFYLFGMVLFFSLQWAYITIDNSKTPGEWVILREFAPRFIFAFNVFFIFLFLHLLQWFVSSSVDKAALHLRVKQAPRTQLG